MTLTSDKLSGVLKISGTLDIDAANPLREALLESFLRQAELVADLSEVDNCDSSALQVLLASKRHAASTGKTFRIIAPSSAVTEMMAALGLSIDEIGESWEGQIDAR